MLLLYAARLFRQCRKPPNLPPFSGGISVILYVYAFLSGYIQFLCKDGVYIPSSLHTSSFPYGKAACPLDKPPKNDYAANIARLEISTTETAYLRYANQRCCCCIKKLVCYRKGAGPQTTRSLPKSSQKKLTALAGNLEAVIFSGLFYHDCRTPSDAFEASGGVLRLRIIFP